MYTLSSIKNEKLLHVSTHSSLYFLFCIAITIKAKQTETEQQRKNKMLSLHALFSARHSHPALWQIRKSWVLSVPGSYLLTTSPSLLIRP
jgi:hypothetical protein